MANYINEAFKQFHLMEDMEEFPVDSVGLDNLGSFIGQAMDDETPVDIIDLEAETIEDLKKSYVGKIICDCNICHSHIFYDKEDIEIDDDGVVNPEQECPYCMSTDGFTIIGEIKDWSPEDELEEDSFEDDELADEPIEITELEVEDDDVVEDDEVGEEADDEANDDEEETLTESIEDVQITTEDETVEITTKEDDGIVVETTPIDDEVVEAEDSMEFYDDMDMAGAEDAVDEPFEDEVIAPIDDEMKDEIIADSEVSDEDVEETEEISVPEEDEDVDVEEFDEETFDELGESYLRRNYNNVSNFKTTQVRVNENLLLVDGVITFKSGNKKKTNFVFESTASKAGKFLFEGFNTQINKGTKAFKMTCSIDGKKIIPESLKYNYTTSNPLNESVKVSGTIKAKRKVK